jgi:hypothetical protein
MPALYWRLTDWLSNVSVAEVEPPVLLKTSLPPQLIVTALVPPWITSLAAIREPSAGAVGRVMVTAPDVVSTGTKSPAAAE